VKLSQAKAAQKRAAAGGWIRNIPVGETGLTVDIRSRRVNNADADRVRYEIVQSTREAGAEPSKEERRGLLVKVFSQAITTDWSLVDDDDNPVPYSPETAEVVFNDEVIGEAMLAAAIVAAAEVERLGEAAFEEDAKN